MDIQFLKISDDEHQVCVVRGDGSSEEKKLPSRSFFYHDIAHFVAESETGMHGGFWGRVAAGASMEALALEDAELMLAEALAGPIQTLVKNEAPANDYGVVLARVIPAHPNTAATAQAMFASVRHIRGMWRATNYGHSMKLTWSL